MTDPDLTTPHDPSGDPAPPAPTVGRFVLGPELGRGAFGVVHRAFDPTLGREVAIKLPKAADVPPELIERFTREARAAAGLRHPHVVAVFDAGVDAGRPFIAMELVDGPTLAERAGGSPSHRQAASWVRDLAMALHHAHTAGVLHRDVKPGNVLVDVGGRVRLTDFGISKLTLAEPAAADESAPAATRDGTLMGSPGYMSPEQARGDVAAVGPASDQYSLGVVLYELLTGRRPFPGSAADAMGQAADPDALPPPPRVVDASIPLGLEAVVLKAMQKAPADRYASAADFAVDLQRWLKEDPVEAPLRVQGRPVRVCPGCGRANKLTLLWCMGCGLPLADALVRDSAELPADATRDENRRMPVGATPAVLRTVERGLAAVGARVKLTLVAVGLLVLGVFVTAVFGTPSVGRVPGVARYAVFAALALLAVGAVVELAGLMLCLRWPHAWAVRGTVAAALLCQLLAPTSVVAALNLENGPGGVMGVTTLWGLSKPDGRNDSSSRAKGPSRSGAAGTRLWVVCLIAGGLFGLAGWVLSVTFLERLAWHLDCRQVQGQPFRILVTGAVAAVGPSVLLFVAAFVLQPVAQLVFAILVGVAAVGLVVSMLLNWAGIIGELRYELRRQANRL